MALFDEATSNVLDPVATKSTGGLLPVTKLHPFQQAALDRARAAMEAAQTNVLRSMGDIMSIGRYGSLGDQGAEVPVSWQAMGDAIPHIKTALRNLDQMHRRFNGGVL